MILRYEDRDRRETWEGLWIARLAGYDINDTRTLCPPAMKRRSIPILLLGRVEVEPDDRTTRKTPGEAELYTQSKFETFKTRRYAQMISAWAYAFRDLFHQWTCANIERLVVTTILHQNKVISAKQGQYAVNVKMLLAFAD
jgi:hypothetical protein